MNIQLYSSLFDIPKIKKLEYQTIYITYSNRYETDAQQAYEEIISGNLNSNCGIQYRVDFLPIPEQQKDVFGFTIRRFDFSALGRYALLTYSYEPTLDSQHITKALEFIRTAEEYTNWDRNEWIKECNYKVPPVETQEESCGVQSSKGTTFSDFKKEKYDVKDKVFPSLQFEIIIPSEKEVITDFTAEGFSDKTIELEEETINTYTESPIAEEREVKNTLEELTNDFNRLLKEKLKNGFPLNAKLLQDIAKEMSVLVPEDDDVKIIVNEKYDVILTTDNKEEITLKFNGIIDKVLYLFFLVYAVSIPLRDLCDYKKELNRIYLYCKPGASDETRIQAIDNLIDTSTGTVNQVKSRISKAISLAIPSPSQNEKLKITGKRNGNFSIKIDRSLVSIFGKFDGLYN